MQYSSPPPPTHPPFGTNPSRWIRNFGRRDHHVPIVPPFIILKPLNQSPYAITNLLFRHGFSAQLWCASTWRPLTGPSLPSPPPGTPRRDIFVPSFSREKRRAVGGGGVPELRLPGPHRPFPFHPRIATCRGQPIRRRDTIHPNAILSR